MIGGHRILRSAFSGAGRVWARDRVPGGGWGTGHDGRPGCGGFAVFRGRRLQVRGVCSRARGKARFLGCGVVAVGATRRHCGRRALSSGLFRAAHAIGKSGGIRCGNCRVGSRGRTDHRIGAEPVSRAGGGTSSAQTGRSACGCRRLPLVARLCRIRRTSAFPGMGTRPHEL